MNETGAPESETTACGALSLLVQVTVVPDFTVSVAGVNTKSLMAMVFPAGAGAGVAEDGADEL